MVKYVVFAIVGVAALSVPFLVWSVKLFVVSGVKAPLDDGVVPSFVVIVVVIPSIFDVIVLSVFKSVLLSKLDIVVPCVVECAAFPVIVFFAVESVIPLSVDGVLCAIVKYGVCSVVELVIVFAGMVAGFEEDGFAVYGSVVSVALEICFSVVFCFNVVVLIVGMVVDSVSSVPLRIVV